MTELTPAEQQFILHWGEMGTRWGINRTMAQIHAQLFLAARPMNAEELTERLGVARSNVSTNLRELQNWGIVRLVHLPGDRRDHFESLKDVFEMFRIIMAERKRREIDPTLKVIRQCLEEAEQSKASKETRERLASMLEFFELADSVSRQIEKMPTSGLIRAAKMGDTLFRLMGIGPKD